MYIILIAGVACLVLALVSFIAAKRQNAKSGFSVLALALGATLIVASLCICQIPTGHTGVVTSFGQVKDYTLEAGVHFKAPWHTIIKMDNRVQKDSLQLNCFSSDIQEVSMQYTLNYQIDKTNAQNIYSTIGTDYFSTVIIPCITESVKTVTAKYTAEKLVADRNSLALGIEEELIGRLSQYNINVVATSIEDLDFTDAFTEAVEAKQVAQQNKLKAQTEAEQKVIEAEAEAKVKRVQAQGAADALLIEAEAEAEANRKISDSLTESVLKKQYYEKWNGQLPTTVLGENGSAFVQVP